MQSKLFFFLFNIVNIPKPSADEAISGKRCPWAPGVIRFLRSGSEAGDT